MSKHYRIHTINLFPQQNNKNRQKTLKQIVRKCSIQKYINKSLCFPKELLEFKKKKGR